MKSVRNILSGRAILSTAAVLGGFVGLVIFANRSPDTSNNGGSDDPAIAPAQSVVAAAGGVAPAEAKSSDTTDPAPNLNVVPAGKQSADSIARNFPLRPVAQANDPPPNSASIAAAAAESPRQADATARARTAAGGSDALDIALAHVSAQFVGSGYTAADFADPLVNNRHTSAHNGVTHLYLRQRVGGIEVYNANLNAHVLENGTVVAVNNAFVADLASEINSTEPTITADEAVLLAAASVVGPADRELKVVSESNDAAREVIFEGGALAVDPIPAKLMYLPLQGKETRLVWNTVLHLRDGQNWLDMNVDAGTGEVLSQANWIANAGYRVFASPAENPDEGARTLESNPQNTTASPFGWHDTNGAAGAEFSDTRGNNVNAQEDKNADNIGGARPSGGAGLTFDFPLDLNLPPSSYESASITNLFYWNNVLHDLHYHYGFDEAAGNFQINNYGNGGAGNDAVEADSLDGSGTNNANFGTPPDGSKPRMQMFLWSGTENKLSANSPAGIAGDYPTLPADFGPALEADLTSALVLANDGSSQPTRACSALVNGAAMAGKIALIDRGGCNFVSKVKRAQNAGAVAVLVANSQVGGGPFRMGGVDPTITIPAFSISLEDGAILRSSGSVNVTLRAQVDRDSSLDNVIIIHEYGHGVSNRLTGGAANSSALQAAQSRSMGEGWSDWWGLVFTARSTDVATTARSVGNYVLGEDANGAGIRPYPYTTNFAVNPQTYGDIGSGTLSVPHGAGSVWCTTLWEVYWELVTAHGLDSDFYTGSGGNNIALQLIMDGLKLQPANPSFLDARDAILLADQINNAGANLELLWRAFAKRGMGFSAYDGGSPNSLDVIEAFDLPDDLSIDPSARDLFRPAGAPGGPFVPGSRDFTLENTGGSPLNWTATETTPWLDLSTTSGSLAAGATTTVTASLNAAAISRPAGSHTATVTFFNLASGTSQQRGVDFSVNHLATALDSPGAAIHTSSPAWFSQSTVTHDGTDAAQSGDVDHDQSSVMELTVNGPDTLVFWWKVSSEQGWDFLHFMVDGEVQRSISGAVNWTRVSHNIPAGSHVIRWEYQKDITVDGGADTGWVDEIAFSSNQPPIITGSQNSHGFVGQPFSYQIDATENPTSYSSGTLPSGIVLNPSTGEISGTPSVAGDSVVQITATNSFGSHSEDLDLAIRTVASLPFTENFESSNLGSHWLAGGTSGARTQLTQSHNPFEGNWHLTMDAVGGNPARNELTMALDLNGQSDVVLTFWAREFSDESHGPPSIPFVGGADFDGVAISANGVHWYETKALRGEISGGYRIFAVDLDAAIARHGLSYNSSFRIRFNHFDDGGIPDDGFAFDDIKVQSIVPYTDLNLTSGGDTPTPTFSGTADPGAYITLSSHRDGVIGSVVADGSGNWTLVSGPLRPGQHRITASVYGLPTTLLVVNIVDDSPGGEITHELVPFESQWRFLDDGSDQYTAGTAFFHPTFDDTGWQENFARFGYGDDGEATVVSYGGNASDRHITTYFRKDFEYESGDTGFERGVLSLYADDGAMVYLNGSLLQRHNMPGGSVGSETLASTDISGDHEQLLNYYEFDLSLINEGSNSIAVAVHQRSPSSPDLGFDLRLALTRDWFFQGTNLDNTFREVEEFVTTDLDNDGDADILYTHSSGSGSEFRYRLNLGNNLLDTPVTIDTETMGTNNSKPILADLNNDGLMDFVAFSSSGHGYRAYTNNGIGNGFTRELWHTNFGAYGGCLGDLDGDGYLDLIYQRVNSGGSTTDPAPVYWRKNDQTGDFGNQQLIANKSRFLPYSGTHALDVDGDGDTDLLASVTLDNEIMWLENDGTGNFPNEHSLITIDAGTSVHPGDLDGDGDLDLLLDQAGKTVWYRNDGNFNFSFAHSIQLERFLDYIRLSDLDNDGDLDLLCRFNPFNEHVEWRENDGNGNFSQAQRFIDDNSDVIPIGDVEAVDWTGNGATDVILRLHGGGDLRLIESKFGSGARINSLSVSDNTVATGDSVTLTWTTEGASEVKLDGVVVAANGNLVVPIGAADTVFELRASSVDGSATKQLTVFVPENTFDTGRLVVQGTLFDYVYALAAADIDGNGTQDLVYSSRDSNDIGWLSNDGAANFSGPNLIDGNFDTAFIVQAGDLDGDGDPDVAGMAGDDDLVWWSNNGDGTFSGRKVIEAGKSGSRMWLRDVSGDGNLDILVSSGRAYVYVNLGNGSFLPAIDIGGTGEDFSFEDFTEDGITDQLKSNGSAIYLAPGTGPLQYTSGSSAIFPESGIRDLLVKDWDNDGHLDFFTVAAHWVRYFGGRGRGQFQIDFEQNWYNLGSIRETILGDFDSDGDDDMAFLARDNFSLGTVFWREGDGRGNFSDAQIIQSEVPVGWTIIASDLDSDGHLDLAIGSERDDSITWFRNRSGRPAAPTLSGESNSGATSDNLTSSSNPDFLGTVEPGATISLYSSIDGFIGTTVADGTGFWAITAGKLSDGEHLITVSTRSDDFSHSLQVVIDTAAEAPTNLDLEPDSDLGFSNNDDLTSDTTPVIHGSAETGSAIVLSSSIDGVVGSGIANNEFWIQTSELSEGTHQITAVATDLAGNVSTLSQPLTITIDTTPPAAVSAPDLTDGSDSGTSSSDNLTNDSTPTFSGDSDAGSTVKIYAGSTEIGSGPGGSGWSITTSELADGLHQITVRQTDESGNLSPSSPALPMTVDLVAPVVTIAAPTGDPTFAVTTYSIDLGGTATDSSSVSLVEWQNDRGDQGTATGTENWSANTIVPFNGQNVFTVTATDSAGNTGTDVLTAQNDQLPELNVTWKIGDMVADRLNNLVYVVNETGSDVIAISTATGAVEAVNRFEFDLDGSHLFPSSDGSKLYVSVPKIQKLYTLVSGTLIETAVSDLERRIGSFVIAADGFCYACDEANPAAQKVVKLDPVSGQELARLSSPAIATDPLLRSAADGSRFYLLEKDQSAATGKVTEFATGAGPPTVGAIHFLDAALDRDLSVDDANDKLYRASELVDGISTWNITAQSQELRTFSGSSFGSAVAQLPGGLSVWGASADPQNAVVAEFEKSSNTAIQQLAVGGNNSSRNAGTLMNGRLEITPNGRLLYAKSQDTGSNILYYIGFVDAASNSLNYNAPSEVPFAPSDLTASDGSDDSGVTLAWNPSSRASEYRIYRSTAAAPGSAAQIASGIINTSYTDASALPDTTYFYWVTAVNNDGESPFGFGASGQRPLGHPTELTASDATDQDAVILTWQATAGTGVSYAVYRAATDNSNGAAEISSGIVATTYADTSAAMGVTYFYWVQAVDGNGPGAWSTSDSGRRKIAVPSNLSIDLEDSAHVLLNWAEITGSSGFKIYRGTTSDPNSAGQIGRVTGNTFTDTTAVPNVLYYWFVRTEVGADDGEFSASISGRRIFVAPQNVTATSDSVTAVIVRWDRISSPVGQYEIYRSATPDINNAARIGVQASTGSAYFDATPARGVPHHYWVRAITATTNGAFSVPAVGSRLGETFQEFTNRYGLSGNDALAGVDLDGDGASNFEEWAQGLSDPTDSSSRPQRVIRFQTIATETYFTVSYLRLLGGTEVGATYQQSSANYTAGAGHSPGTLDQDPVTAQTPAGMPTAPDGYEWGCFRLPFTTDESALGFLHLLVEPVP